MIAATEDARRELVDRERCVQAFVGCSMSDYFIRDLHLSEGSTTVLSSFLVEGKAKRICPLCARDMNAQELVTYDKMVSRPVKLLDSAIYQFVCRSMNDSKKAHQPPSTKPSKR